VGFGCCSIHSRSRAQSNTKTLWDGWEEKGLRAKAWELGGEGCDPCEEEAPTPNGKKIVKPDHAAAFSALLFRLPTGKSKVSGRLGSPLPPPLLCPFFVNLYLKFTCPEVNLLSFRAPGRATNEIAGDPDQLWPAPPARANAKSIPPGPGRVELP